MLSIGIEAVFWPIQTANIKNWVGAHSGYLHSDGKTAPHFLRLKDQISAKVLHNGLRYVQIKTTSFSALLKWPAGP